MRDPAELDERLPEEPSEDDIDAAIACGVFASRADALAGITTRQPAAVEATTTDEDLTW